MRFLLFPVIASLVFGAARADNGALLCDGTDAALLAELDEAMRTGIGYGETWDETICNQGTAVAGFAAPHPKRRPKSSGEEQFLALVMPMVAFGGLGFAVVVAAIFGFIARSKKTIVKDVPCPHCDTVLPITLDGSSIHLFCPACGKGCLLEVRGRGKDAVVHAVAGAA
jgi:hypothetical protein